MRRSKQTIFGSLAAAALAMVSAYAMAQPKPSTPSSGAASAADAGVACGAGQACKHGALACPMTELASLSDFKLENTKTGATLQLVAKDTRKVAELQALAVRLVDKMKLGDCPMMDGAKHPHGQHHGHRPPPTK